VSAEQIFGDDGLRGLEDVVASPTGSMTLWIPGFTGVVSLVA